MTRHPSSSEVDSAAGSSGSLGSPPRSDASTAARFEGGDVGFVLLVDDEPLLLRALQRILQAEGHRVELAANGDEVEECLGDADLGVVLVDLVMGRTSGLDVLDRIKRARPDVEVIVMTGHASIESAVGCMRRGAFDYLAKPFEDVHRVRIAVKRALERGRLVRRNRELEEELRNHSGQVEMIGRSPAIRALQRAIRSLRHNESHVLIQGESGTGKELIARAVHEHSPRADGPFVPVDCGALPESIIESELFGHEKGAFTGAVGAPGLFRMADRGTLFLDEIGELSPAVQAKLLRALQYKEVRPVGATRPVPVDIRIVAATHRDLTALVESGEFRVDLYYRLNVVRLEAPLLRDRESDIPLLVHHFIRKHRRKDSPVTGIEEAALELLAHRSWPGNVRELENAIESALAMAHGPRLAARDLRLSPTLRSNPCAIGASPESLDALPLSLAAYEKSALERALQEVGGDASSVARALGMGRSTLYRKLAKYGLSARQSSGERVDAVVSGLGALRPIG